MPNLWDDIAKTIREGVDTVVEKTEELTKIGRIKVDLINIKRNIDKNFSELGGKVYHLMVEEKKTQVASDSEVKKIIDSIKLLEKELNSKNAEIEKIKAEAGKGTKPAEKPQSTATKPSAKSGTKTTAKSGTKTTGKTQTRTSKTGSAKSGNSKNKK